MPCRPWKPIGSRELSCLFRVQPWVAPWFLFILRQAIAPPRCGEKSSPSFQESEFGQDLAGEAGQRDIFKVGCLDPTIFPQTSRFTVNCYRVISIGNGM